jgi:hypothetical protein
MHRLFGALIIEKQSQISQVNFTVIPHKEKQRKQSLNGVVKLLDNP